MQYKVEEALGDLRSSINYHTCVNNTNPVVAFKYDQLYENQKPNSGSHGQFATGYYNLSRYPRLLAYFRRFRITWKQVTLLSRPFSPENSETEFGEVSAWIHHLVSQLLTLIHGKLGCKHFLSSCCNRICVLCCAVFVILSAIYLNAAGTLRNYKFDIADIYLLLPNGYHIGLDIQ